MALTDEQRAELEAADPQTIRIKLLQGGAGRTAIVPGLDTAPLRGDVEGWLAEKSALDVGERQQTLRWAKIAGWATIISVIHGANSNGKSCV